MAAYEITVSASFPGRHSVTLRHGATEPPHQHDWQVVAVLRADRLDANGFVADFVAVQQAVADVTAPLARADLNELLGPAASAERLAEYLAGQLEKRLGRKLHCLRVQEAPGCWAAFYPGAAARPA